MGLPSVSSQLLPIQTVDMTIFLEKNGSELTALYLIHIPFGETLYLRSVWYKDLIDDIHKDTAGWVKEIRKRENENAVEIGFKMKET